jgi:hypothetical protein
MGSMERLRETLERIARNMRPLVEHVEAQERQLRLCPICRCEYVLEWHDENCAYNDARDALALLDVFLDKPARHIDERIAGD